MNREMEEDLGKKDKIYLLKEKIFKYKKEALDNYDKYLRALADFDNYRKRIAKEWLENQRRGNEDLILKILPIMDDLERALEAGKVSNNQVAFHQGVEMIYNRLKGVLETQGVKAYSSVGEVFDPHRHEAILLVETKEHPPNIVMSEIEKGYFINDRILRPARVVVSKEGSEKEEQSKI